MTFDISNFAKATIDPAQVTGGVGGGSLAGTVYFSPSSPFILGNSTPTYLTASPPNDGMPHYFICLARMTVTSAMTGGGTHAAWTSAGIGQSPSLFSAQPAGTYSNYLTGEVDPGATFQLNQATNLTAGAAKIDSVVVWWF